MLTFKNKKETDKELNHIDVYNDGVFIGYIIRNDSLAAPVNMNWNFCTKMIAIPNLHGKTKKELIDKIKFAHSNIFTIFAFEPIKTNKHGKKIND